AAMAALFTRMSMVPRASSAWRATSAGASTWPRSATTTTGSLPSPRATASRSCAVRATSATRAPARSRARAVAAPIPREAPVTKPQHPGGGPWQSITNAAGATAGFVGDAGTGAYDSVKGSLEMGWKLSPVRGVIDPDGVSRDARAFDQAIWHGITHPAELGKA